MPILGAEAGQYHLRKSYSEVDKFIPFDNTKNSSALFVELHAVNLQIGTLQINPPLK